MFNCEMCQRTRINVLERTSGTLVCEWCQADSFLAKAENMGDVNHYNIHLDNDETPHIYLEILGFSLINGFSGAGHPISKLMNDYGFNIRRIQQDDVFRIWLVKS